MKPRNDVWLDVVTPDLPVPVRVRVRGRSMLPTLRPGDELLVEPVAPDALVAGDLIAVRNAQGGFVHRYLGRRAGQVLTKGDGHPGFDPLWPPEAVLGRVVEARRDGRRVYRRAGGRMRREKLLTFGHRVMGEVWAVGRRFKALLLVLLSLFLGISLAIAAVTLTDFYAEGEEDKVILYWETASETNNLGFYVWRSISETEGYDNISLFIESQDQGAGAFYEYEDVNVLEGITYYYRLQDLPADGGDGQFTDPITASLDTVDDPTPTVTPTATLTPTATATVTPGPTPTDTPTPTPDSANVRFWTEETTLEAGDCTTVRWQTDNVKAILLDGDGVDGDGAKVYCPCETETHTLRVTYQDDTSEDFTVTLSVTGRCSAATWTPTPTRTPEQTATPQSAAPTLEPPGSATATPVPEQVRSTMTPRPTDTPVSTVTPPRLTQTPTSPASTPLSETPTVEMSRATATRSIVEGESQGIGVDAAFSVWLLVVGGIVGLGFVGAGILMWKRQQ